jgi:protein-disulfide isomerase
MKPPTRREVVALAAVAGGGWAAGQWLGRARPVGRDVSASAAARAVLADRSAPHRDVAGADLTLVVFSDYRCGACRSAHPAMRAAVAADGRVRTMYKDWPIFGPVSEHAARRALSVVPQGLYPAVYDRLMTAAGSFDDAMLTAEIRAAGADPDKAARHLADHRAAIDATIAANARQAVALALPGTPAYLAGGRLAVGALDESGFARLFAEARA